MKLVRKQRKGFTLIELLIVIAVIAILASIAIPNLLASRESANEASAIGSIRTIDSAEAIYRSRNADYSSLGPVGAANTLATAGLVDPSVGNGNKSGFLMAAVPGQDLSNTNSDTKFFAVAVPASSSSGQRDFYSDETGVIFSAPDTDGLHASLPATDSSGVAPATGTWTQVGN